MSSPTNTPHLFQRCSPRLEQVGGLVATPAPTRPAYRHTAGQQGDVTKATRTLASRVLLTVEAAAAQLAIGRTSMFALIKAGHIESVKVGRLRRVPADALTAYVNRLITEQHAA